MPDSTTKKPGAADTIDAIISLRPNAVNGADLDAALRSAVRAVLPGRQQRGNLAPHMDAARRAFVRTLRRRAAP